MTTKRSSGKRPKVRKAPVSRHSLAALAKQLRQEEASKVPSEPSTSKVTASERKISESEALVNPERSTWSGFRVIDIDRVFSNILEHVACKKCRGAVKLEEKKVVGLSSLFELVCHKCGELKKFRNCELLQNNNGSKESEANRRFVYASQVLGFKHAGMKTLAAIMDFPKPISYNLYKPAVQKIHTVLKTVSEESMIQATEEEVENQNSKDISVSGDGSWQKRGFSSKNGVVTLIGLTSGKVIDVEVLSTVCQTCNVYQGPKKGIEFEEWTEKHQETCSINHVGSSGMMEVTGMSRIFKRSEARAGVRYARYIGDGDSKTFSNIVKEKPYGDFIPKKVECTGHVQKRMGSRLRKLKKDMKGKKLSDNKPLGGKGRLTDQWIDRIASYYGNAIRSSSSIEEMKSKVMAIFHHYRSTDKQPEHHLCPAGEGTWCKYQLAVMEDHVTNYKHTTSLPVPVMDAVLPIFTELTEDSLLEKCIGGHTQNPNESFNSIVWQRVPKTVFCGKTVLELGVCDAICVFNSGQKSRLQIMERFGVIPGNNCVSYCNIVDQKRVTQGRRRSLEASKEARTERRRKEKDARERKEQEEEIVYNPGAF